MRERTLALYSAATPDAAARAAAMKAVTGSTSGDNQRIELLAETALWPLYSRAADAVSRRPILGDTFAAELVRRIPYDFARLGKPSVWLAIREKKIDVAVERFIQQAGGRGTVLSLGAGLETRAMRLALPSVDWVGVDLPPVIRLRAGLLGEHERYRLVAGSVMNIDWQTLGVDARRLMIVAAGLLMYLSRDAVRDSLRALAAAFPGARMIFDTIHPRYAARSLAGLARAGELRLPAMPWGIAIDDVRCLGDWLPVEVLHVEDFARGYRWRCGVAGWAAAVPLLRNRVADALVTVRLGHG